MMNPKLEALQPYPFEKLRALKDGITPPADKAHIALSIGEPKHTPPPFILEKITQNLNAITQYPLTKGVDELRSAMANWATQRFHLHKSPIDPHTQILPVCGTREGLFSFVQAAFNSDSKKRKILLPNPFYQIYEGAALLAGAEIEYINCREENDYQPDFGAISEQSWQDCQILFICTPGNPTAKVMDRATLKHLIELSLRYDFIIASDECYSELYFDERSPPPGLLEACSELGHTDFKNCVVFHSLSKRSNVPGLRSGFVAGDRDIMERYLQYRTYHGCAMPYFAQLASITAWQDENHVIANRALYREKFSEAAEIFGDHIDFQSPQAGFYFWLKTPCNDAEFARELFAQQNVTVLPGTYLARSTKDGNPGESHVRIALVAAKEECLEAAQRIKNFVRDNF